MTGELGVSREPRARFRERAAEQRFAQDGRDLGERSTIERRVQLQRERARARRREAQHEQHAALTQRLQVERCERLVLE
jgi:hypothetical protein